jgi:cystathionine gamma-synthase
MKSLTDHLLITEPKWTPEDLGAPLPDSPHANSVCLPTWRDVVEYEEKSPRVIERLRAGYPRFVIPSRCAEFFTQCRNKFARDGELCHAYPSEKSARRCVDMIRRWSDAEARIAPWGDRRVFVVCFPASAEPAALKYWRHSGDGISSRQAEAILSGLSESRSMEARLRVSAKIARHAGVPEDCVFLFKSGMAAIYALHRTMARLQPDGTCVQFGFPYVDTLKIQQDFGYRSTFFPLGNKNDLRMLSRMCLLDRVGGLFCEFPSNPLLTSPDLRALSQLGKNHNFPIVVDDTLSTWINIDVSSVADASVTSLTKYFSGRGDLMSGVAVLYPGRPLHATLKAALRAEYDDCTWGNNLVLLDEYSDDFSERVRHINQTAEPLCDWLRDRPEVEKVFYPKFQDRAMYDAYKRPEGGYGGMFSLRLKNAALTSAPFYEALKLCKGPNLGTVFSLCCPFTLLAHFDELDWAERCGVSRYLLRFSIGLERLEELKDRFARAFAAIA